MRKISEELVRGITPPEGSCDDDKCPWHGNISLRNAILEGRVVSTRMTRTVSVLIEYLHYNKKYKRYERRRSKIHAHLPPCLEVNDGDFVRIVETRRLAKTVSHVVLGRLK
ncbi:MAG: 30S ribosomal protein S17 [Candidatus Korarchaeum sp.]